MAELARRRTFTWLAPVLMVLLALVLAGLLALGPLTAYALQQRLIAPPEIQLRLGRYEVVAPCPPQIYCDDGTPYVGMWLGTQWPDGSMNYRSILFMYRETKKRH